MHVWHLCGGAAAIPGVGARASVIPHPAHGTTCWENKTVPLIFSSFKMPVFALFLINNKPTYSILPAEWSVMNGGWAVETPAGAGGTLLY